MHFDSYDRALCSVQVEVQTISPYTIILQVLAPIF